jgi:hypothetical protein
VTVPSPTLAVPYLRVSTDDKGQDPKRQLEVIRPWAEREGVTLLDAVLDEGTSATKTNPFERKKFLGACERANRCRCRGHRGRSSRSLHAPG